MHLRFLDSLIIYYVARRFTYKMKVILASFIITKIADDRLFTEKVRTSAIFLTIHIYYNDFLQNDILYAYEQISLWG